MNRFRKPSRLHHAPNGRAMKGNALEQLGRIDDALIGIIRRRLPRFGFRFSHAMFLI
jgi:hypothetical protein